MSGDHAHVWVVLRSDSAGGWDSRRVCRVCEVFESRGAGGDSPWVRDATGRWTPRVPPGYLTWVTGMRSSGGGTGPELEVEVTVSRVPAYLRLPGIPPSPADVPPDVRDMLRSWLDEAES